MPDRDHAVLIRPRQGAWERDQYVGVEGSAGGEGVRIHKALVRSSLTGVRGRGTLPSMEDARQRVIRKFMALPEDKQQKLCDSLGALMAQLKAEWEAKPENAGKTVSYKDLWQDFLKKKNNGYTGEGTGR